MKLRWHVLWSLVCAAGSAAVANVIWATNSITIGAMLFVFVLYWALALGNGDVDVDPGDFF